MLTELKITKANPAGNTTLIIEGEVPAHERASLGARLITMPGIEAEQAGFVVPPEHGGAGRLEMMGGEFCGNASRAFGMYCMKQYPGMRENVSGDSVVTIEISGCEDTVKVYCREDEQSAEVEMPLPVNCAQAAFPLCGEEFPVVEFDGIAHIIAIGREPDEKLFELIKKEVYGAEKKTGLVNPAPAALGMMFMSADLKRLTPLVYVEGPHTLYYEGSCASGSCAAAYYLAQKAGPVETGLREYVFQQPAGELKLTVRFDNDRVTSVRAGGKVSFEEPVTIMTDI